MTKERSSFTGKIGFVLAAAGSAVGLGNIWRFPYLAAKYGGGIFLLVYLILAVTFGFALMVAEIAIGRKTGKSPFEAFKSLNPKWGFLGKLTTIVPIIIFPYYCVIGGWVMKYVLIFFGGQLENAAGAGYFGNYIAQPVEPVVWLSIFILITAVVVIMGVQKGIENASKFMMPVLAVLAVVIALFVVCRPEAIEGLKFYLLPDFSKFSVMTVLGAMGQLFYSMSLAMGIMITYGSYMKKDNSIESCVRQIELFDTGIAFLAGLMIIPSVFVFSGGDPAALGAGPGLMFMALPKVFATMKMGTLIGALFFILVFFAALTSAISLMETIVSFFMDKLGWSRKFAGCFVAVLSFAIGVPSSLGFGAWSFISWMGMSVLDIMDFVSNSVLMPIVACITCIFVGHVIGTKAIADEVKATDGKFKAEKLFTVMIKYVCPIFLIIILASSVATLFGFSL